MIKFFLAALLPFFLVSCASTDDSTTHSEDEVTSIPWNRPESWEGQGAMGGFIGTQ